MSILTIHPKDEAQEKALKAIFEAFSIKYEKELDETEYLKVSEANAIALNKSIEQLDADKGVKISFMIYGINIFAVSCRRITVLEKEWK